MTAATGVGRGARVLASAFLTIGTIGAIGSSVALLVAHVAAPGNVDAAWHVFLGSGTVLCVAGVLFAVARKALEGTDE